MPAPYSMVSINEIRRALQERKPNWTWLDEAVDWFLQLPEEEQLPILALVQRLVGIRNLGSVGSFEVVMALFLLLERQEKEATRRR